MTRAGCPARPAAFPPAYPAASFMLLARVIGHATSSVKHPAMSGWKLLLVRPLDIAGRGEATPVIAVDPHGAGIGDEVLISSDGKTTRELMGTPTTPVRWSVIGLPDGVPRRGRGGSR